MTKFGLLSTKEVGGIAFDIDDEENRKILKEKVFKFAEEVNETTKEKLRVALSIGILEGEGVAELSKRVVKAMNVRIKQANTIARTETIGTANTATFQGYKQSGIKMKKQWLSAHDTRTRDAHARMDGVTIDLDENFNVYGVKMKYPHDPSGGANNLVNCRCTLISVIK